MNPAFLWGDEQKDGIGLNGKDKKQVSDRVCHDCIMLCILNSKMPKSWQS